MNKDKIIFTLEPKTQYYAELSSISDNIIQLVFEDKVPAKDVITSDILIINEHNDSVQGVFKGYSTIYREFNDPEFEVNDKKFQLSNDGIVYVKPVPIPEPEPQPIPIYEPTIEEVRNNKIREIQWICENSILSGVDVEIDGEVKHFSYSLEDQNNLDDAFYLASQTGLSQPYHADGMSCKLYSKDDIVKIYIAEKTNKTHHVTYFNQLKAYVYSLEDKDILNSITYGEELQGEYLETYNTIMNQSKEIMDSIITDLEK